MATLTLVFPPGMQQFADSKGNTVTPDSTGRVAVDPTVVVLADFVNAGFQQAPDVASASRPTVTYPGQPYFDTSLNSGVGLPIWRNAANTAWINAAGTTV